ncbi:MAG: hypothetical protein Q9184_006859, partial [Pyrenodesmia sp. 2 TL-2023]
SPLERINDVVYDYHTKGAVEDVLTHVLPQYGYNGTSNETTNFSPVVYNAAVDALPPSLSGWINTPHTSSTLRFTKYADLVEEFNEGYPNGLVASSPCTPNRQFFADVWSFFRQWLQNYRHIDGFYGLHCNMPITPHAIAQGYANGGNALGLQSPENRTLSGNVLRKPISFFSLGVDRFLTTVPVRNSALLRHHFQQPRRPGSGIARPQYLRKQYARAGRRAGIA